MSSLRTYVESLEGAEGIEDITERNRHRFEALKKLIIDFKDEMPIVGMDHESLTQLDELAIFTNCIRGTCKIHYGDFVNSFSDEDRAVRGLSKSVDRDSLVLSLKSEIKELKSTHKTVKELKSMMIDVGALGRNLNNALDKSDQRTYSMEYFVTDKVTTGNTRQIAVVSAKSIDEAHTKLNSIIDKVSSGNFATVTRRFSVKVISN